MASSSASLSDSRSEGRCRIGIYISTSSSSLTQEKNVPQLCEWVFVFVCVCVNKCCDRAACQSARVMSGNKNKRDECDARIASSVSLRSTVIVSLFSPQLIPGSPALHPLGPNAHFISIHPTTPSIRCTCLLGSIYHRNSLLIWVPPPTPSPHLSSDHPSLPFVHISWSWIIPFSLPRLSLFVSLSSLLSPASSSLLSFLNPNAVSSSKCCWINHKESMNPCVFGDFLPCFWCHKGGSVIGKCTSTHRIARLQLYLWFGR